MVTRREGGCHCGAVRIAVDMPDAPRPHLCNCSICAMKATVAIDVPMEALTVVSGEDALACYSFNTGVAKHWFCKTCGIHVFQQLRSDPEMYGVNGACFDGLGRFDFAALPVVDSAKAHPKDTGQPSQIAGTMRYDTADDGTGTDRTG